MSRPVITAADRLAFTLVLALLVHGLLVFGLRFVPPTLPAPPVLEVTWVPLTQATAPVRADFIAVAAAEGEAAQALRAAPSEPAPAPVPAMPTPASAPPPPVVTTTAASVAALEQAITALAAEVARTVPTEAPARTLTLDAASARADAWAGWLQQFRDRVEVAGNAGFPAAIREQGLTGDVRLRVTVAPDGRLLALTVLRSSGQPLLDQAALQSVRDAQPLPPFPPAVRDQVDRLQLVRTWRFASLPDAGL